MAPVWHNLAEQREAALAVRGSKLKERLTANTKDLIPLEVGDTCIVQNQIGNFPKRWDKTGTIVAREDFDQYRVCMDGSRRITLRNRKFLRKVTSFHDTYSAPTHTTVDINQTKTPGHHGDDNFADPIQLPTQVRHTPAVPRSD